MKHNIKHLPLFFSRLSLVIVLAFSLALVPGPHTQASSLSLDQNFNTPFFAVPSLPARGVVLLPDGKYVMFSPTSIGFTLADHSTGPIMRFNSDGTLDTTFSFSHDYSGVCAVAPMANGQLIVSATKTVYGVTSLQHQVFDILRLNADGSIDPTFGPAQSTDGAEVRVITVNADGKIFAGGRFTAFNGQPRNGIVRLLQNGTIDPDFALITMTCSANTWAGDGLCGVWAEPVVDGDGKIIVAGDFVSVDGVNALCVARLNSDGTLDNAFTASGFEPFLFSAGSPRPIRGNVIQSDGKIVIGGRLTLSGNAFVLPLVRLNTDGSADPSYGDFAFFPPPDGWSYVRSLIIQPDDKVVAVSRSVWRFNNTDGSLDPTFYNPALLIKQQFDTEGGTAEAFRIAVTGDGGLFIGGIFTDIDDFVGPPTAERWGAAKLHSDGTLDTSFTTSHRLGLKIEPGIFTRKTDGSTLITFNSFAPDTNSSAIPHGFGRLLSNGALDSGFDPIASFNPSGPLGPNFISLGFTPLSDGSLLLMGQGGNTASYGHLLANGSEDTNYNADPHAMFTTAFPRSDNKVVLSGYSLTGVLAFVSANLFGSGFPYDGNIVDEAAQGALQGNQVQRIMPDGSIDPNFHLDPLIAADTQQRDANGNLTALYLGSSVLALTANNTTLFSYLSKDGSYHLVRLNDDGSLDTSFTGATFQVSTGFYINWLIDPQNLSAGPINTVPIYYPVDIPVKEAKSVLDNKIVLIGSFAMYGNTPAHGMLRINPDGSTDPTFSVGSGAQWTQTQETDTFHPSVDNLEVGLDDKLLLTGTFEAFRNGTAAPGIISLNPDGTIDTSFIPPVKRQKLDYQPAYLARQSDGSFLLSGPYSRATDNISPSFFRLLLPSGVPTPTGNNVSVNEGAVGSASNVTATFGTVSQAGSTSVSVIDPNWAGQLPSGFQIAGPNLAFEVYTTSSYTSPVTVCFTLSSLDNTMRVLHNNGNGLVDVTSSIDTTTNTICAMVPSLSPFVIARLTFSAHVQQPINADGSSVFTVRRGVVPVKFTLTQNGTATCALPPATIALTRTSGGTTGAIDESVYSGSADNGSNFRIDSCQYVYNLNSGALGVGTYRVDIIINGQVVGGATFQLK
jgi:uncharacterized delta-60 repeat protein